MKPNNWVSSSQATELLVKQLVTWPLAEKNYQALKTVQVKSFDMGGFTIRAQFNPARILSTGAKVDARSLKERKCFLCPSHLPVEQERLPFGLSYLVLCNPYPIFPLHLTIPTRRHTPQLILPQLDDFLELTRRLAPFTLFYNGPHSGASAPDHAHFQAVTPGVMPLDEEIAQIVAQDNRIYPLTGYLRNGFIIQARTPENAAALFNNVYDLLPIIPGEAEPRMNLFGYYKEGQWTLVLIPRKRHRPWQYEAEGADHLLSSPGAADIGGLFITPLREDFDKINPDLLRDVYQQVCMSDREVEEIFVHLPSN